MIEPIKENREEKIRIIDAFQKLSWMMEHCRFSNTATLKLECDREVVVFDMKEVCVLVSRACYICKIVFSWAPSNVSVVARLVTL